MTSGTGEKFFDKFNIMLIGDGSVGKTCILERYFNKKFSSDRKQTIGVECYDKAKIIDDKRFQIKIWDTAGQEKYAVMSRNYYQRANGIVLTCSLTNRDSFNNLKNWLHSIKENSSQQEIQLIIMANKCDLLEEREVKTEEIAQKAKELGVEYFETSAKENINLDEAFNCIINKIYKNYNNTYSNGAFSLDNKNNQEGSGKCHC
jgi:small GTP-binding protein